jgi:hypothetical protein
MAEFGLCQWPENGIKMVKTLEMRALRGYNASEEIAVRKALIFHILQRCSNVFAVRETGTPAMLRAWLP